MVYYFDYSCIDKSSNRGWVKLIAYDGANEGCQFVSLNEANCADGKYREIYIAMYSPQGGFINSTDNPLPWKYGLPNSFHEKIINYICGK